MDGSGWLAGWLTGWMDDEKEGIAGEGRGGGRKGGRKGFRRGSVVIIAVDLVLTLEHITCHSLYLWWEKPRF